MGVATNFRSFCNGLIVDNEAAISARYRQITRRLNLDFYGNDSETSHSKYVGSYGRETAIRDFHDLDVLFRMPPDRYAKYHAYSTNGQSALLQEVRAVLRKTYPNTEIGGDGQVVVVRFTDKMRFEILPAFAIKGKSAFTHADSNGGGRWLVTDPVPEIAAVTKLNTECNGNLKRLCRMARAWRRKWDVDIGGLLIDTLACAFLKTWKQRTLAYGVYDAMSRDFFWHLSEQDASQTYWLAPGSGQRVHKGGAFRQKAKECHALAEAAINHEANGRSVSAENKWKQIYGSLYSN